MATTRAILQHFETWEKAQHDFLSSVAELIKSPLVRTLVIFLVASQFIPNSGLNLKQFVGIINFMAV